ncbi:hypothetical protein GCM10007084_39660 [Parabacteroides faecis]|nr:hypothetical protein GCM10007084_39660 [Parabacteroides faecis]
MAMKVYHGSNMVIEYPKVQTTGFFKDFGFGFYCTVLEKQAQRWAANKTPAHIVNVYEYKEIAGLQILRFKELTDEWLDFIASCRKGVPHTYDLVEGPMADDSVWNYVEDFLSGSISREAFWALAKFKYPTHQIVFCSDRAIESLTYEKSYEL